MRGALADRLDPRLALAVAVLAVSTSAILVRLSDAPETVMALYRVSLTVVLLAPLARGTPAALGRLGARDAAASVVAGLALSAHFAAWFASVDLTTVAASVTLVQTAPAFVAVGAFLLLGERVTRRTVAGIAVAVAGAAVMALGAESGTAPAPLVGNGLALVGAVAAAAYVLGGRSVRQRVAVVPYVLLVYVVAAAGLLAIALAQGLPLGGYPPHEWALFLAMAAGPGVLGHTVVNWALEHVESTLVSVTLVAEPVGAALLALALFGEVPGPATLVGAAVVLAGVTVVALEREG